MLKLGCSIISLWAILNIFASFIIVLVPVLFSGESAPALLESLPQATISNIDSQVLSNANSIAVFANMLNIAISVALIFIVWFGLYKQQKWSLYALVIILSLMLCSGFFADYVSQHDHTLVNLISGVIMFTGLLLSALAIYKPKQI